jgi:hypothetical protein
VNGALVALIDQAGQTVTESLSPESGYTVLRAAPGAYRIRVRRIGFRPFISETITVPHSGELSLNIETPRVVLDAMVVSEKAQCGRINRDAETLSIVWDEIEKALRSSQLTVGDLSGLLISQNYRREVNDIGRILKQDTATIPVTNRIPFAAINPSELATAGYVRGDPATGWQYFGPDEKVLLSSDFIATHCFRVIRDKHRRGEIGLAFSPKPKRDISDIDGVLWVDEKTSELREVRFHFVNAGLLSRLGADGFTIFQRMPSGAWIVKEWQLRVPVVMLTGRGYSASSWLENGGKVTTALEAATAKPIRK